MSIPFKPGDPVWCYGYGVGRVKQVVKNFPKQLPLLAVQFRHWKPERVFLFRLNGYLIDDDNVWLERLTEEQAQEAQPWVKETETMDEETILKPGDDVWCQHFGRGRVECRAYKDMGLSFYPYLKVRFPAFNADQLFNFRLRGEFMGDERIHLTQLREAQTMDNETEETEQKYKEGDFVFTFEDGWGRVLNVLKNTPYAPLYQVKVEFNDGFIISFYSDGRRSSSDFAPTLLTKDQAALLGYHPPKQKKKIFIAIVREQKASGRYLYWALCESSKEGLEKNIEENIGEAEILEVFEREIEVRE